jgi:hypothetical protein
MSDHDNEDARNQCERPSSDASHEKRPLLSELSGYPSDTPRIVSET